MRRKDPTLQNPVWGRRASPGLCACPGRYFVLEATLADGRSVKCLVGVSHSRISDAASDWGQAAQMVFPVLEREPRDGEMRAITASDAEGHFTNWTRSFAYPEGYVLALTC